MASGTIDGGEWLTLSEASKVLGVHPATVRQWSDEGKLATFRTPGGHRRFARTDIERLLHISPVRGVGLQTYLVRETLERTRKGMHEALAHAEWAQRLPEEERARWRAAGRQLVGLVSQLTTRRELGDEERETALRFGVDYGRLMARMGYALPDTVVAFLFFRDSLLETVLELPETTGLDRDATLEIVSRVNNLLNAVLRAMMDAHEATQPEAEGVVNPGGDGL